MTNQRSEPGSAPRRSAGTSPARTTEDLPEPEGPTTARNRAPSVSSPSRRMSRFVSASRPKKSAASASRNARRPLYGLRIWTDRRTVAEPSTAARNAAASSSGVGEAPLLLLRGGPGDHLVAPRGRSGARIADRGQWVAQVAIEQRGERAVRERMGGREHLEHDDPERVDVRPRRGGVEADLLGRQVRGRAPDHRPRAALGGSGVQRDAEVRQVGVPFLVEEHVAGLHVAVDDALAVRRGERGRDLVEDRRRVLPARAVRGGAGPQGCPRGGSASPGRRRRARASSRTAARCAGARAGRRSAPRARSGGRSPGGSRARAASP